MSGVPPGVQLMDFHDIVVAAGQQRLLFDPARVPRRWRRDAGIICISHAHSDHTAGLTSPLLKYATDVTIDIYQELGGSPHRVQSVASEDQISLADGGTLHVYNAGHILGAVQFCVERDGARLVYTGDFNLRPSLTTEGAKTIPCDLLLMEATYGRPGAVFPPRETVYAEIIEWTSQQLKRGRIPTFQVYATGKAQELIRLFNTSLTVPVLVDSKIAKVSDVYCRHQIPLEYSSVTSSRGREILKQGGYVYLSSRKFDRRKFPSGQRFIRATATGWAQLFPIRTVDKAFVLSAHADFQQLVQYVQEVNPKAVFLTNGDTITFGAVLEKLKVKQIIPNRRKQLRLSDFI